MGKSSRNDTGSKAALSTDAVADDLFGDSMAVIGVEQDYLTAEGTEITSKSSGEVE
jgi:hypothetical protein